VKRSYDNAYLKQTSDMVEIFLWDCIKEKLFTAPEKRKELDCTSDPDTSGTLLMELSSHGYE
jgi:hypothetical protein